MKTHLTSLSSDPGLGMLVWAHGRSELISMKTHLTSLSSDPGLGMLVWAHGLGVDQYEDTPH